MRYFIFLFMVAILVVVAVPEHSYSGSRIRGEVKIEVITEGGSTLQNIPHKDFWKGETHVIKKYLEARRGENYGIFIRNNTSDRIGVVIAVDGRNIISGKKSDLKNSEDMYIVNSCETCQYNGWRTASDKIHKFYFTDVADSYAMKTFSDSTAMGVIAVAIYLEKERPRPLHGQKRKDIPSGAPSAESSAGNKAGIARDERASTGFGDEQYSPTIKVAFEPEGSPVQKLLIKYEWREVLCRKGILICGQEPRNRLWDEEDYAPFPPEYPRN
jgi:hypothetical protein